MDTPSILLRRRAIALARLASSMMTDWDDREPETAHALRFGLLVLRRPSGYLRIFTGRDLGIDARLVDRFIRFHSAYLPGPSYLMPEEAELLRIHAEAAVEYELTLPAKESLTLTKNSTGVFAPQ